MQPLFLFSLAATSTVFGSTCTAERLSVELKEGSWDLHERISNHPFLVKLLAEELEAPSYQKYMVDSSCFYQRLESELEINTRTNSELEKIHFPELARASKIEQDLNSVSFRNYPRNASDAALTYADHLNVIGRNNFILLAAHSYLNYAGGMSGGIVMGHILNRKWPDATQFYDFSELKQLLGESNLLKIKLYYKEKLDTLVVDEKTKKELIEEVRKGYLFMEAILESIPL